MNGDGHSMVDLVNSCAETVFYAVSVGAILFGYLQYRRNSTRERAQWVFDLYQRFYERPEMTSVRARIDWEDTAFLDTGQREPLERLDDYLNFFEMIAYLRKRGQLTMEEVGALFDYPLRRLAEVTNVANYVADPSNGYELLRALLAELGHALPKGP